MQRKAIWLVLSCAAVAFAVLYPAETARATPATPGYAAMTVGKGTFAEFQVFNHAPKDTLPAGNDDKVWLSLQKTEGRSDLYVQTNTWQPAVGNAVASTGWHTHPGHSLIIVTAGTITEYEDDCTRHVYNKGDTFVDPGDGHAHILRNEDNVAAATLAVQLVPFDPKGANRRLDASAPENCSNIN